MQVIIWLSVIILVFFIIFLIWDYRQWRKHDNDFIEKYLKLRLIRIFDDFNILVSDLENEQLIGNEPRFGHVYLFLANYIKNNVLRLVKRSMDDYDNNITTLEMIITRMNVIKNELTKATMTKWNPKLLKSIYKLDDKINDLNKMINGYKV